MKLRLPSLEGIKDKRQLKQTCRKKLEMVLKKIAVLSTGMKKSVTTNLETSCRKILHLATVSVDAFLSGYQRFINLIGAFASTISKFLFGASSAIKLYKSQFFRTNLVPTIVQ